MCDGFSRSISARSEYLSDYAHGCPDRRSGMVRYGPWSGFYLVRIFLVRSVVRIFRSGFFRSGPWSGYFGPDFFGPVRGPDISVRISLVRSVSGFLVRIIRTGPDFFVVRSVVRIFFQNKKIRTGPISLKKTSVRSGYWSGFLKNNPDRTKFKL